MKLTSKFKSDLTAVQKLEKYVGNKKLHNHIEPIATKNLNIISPMHNDVTNNIKDFIKNLTNVLKNSAVKKANPTTTFKYISINVNNSTVMRDKTVDVKQYNPPGGLSDVVKFLDANKSNTELINNFISHIIGFLVKWETPNQTEKWYSGVAASIANQEKNNPNWSKD
jgi:hypothetical protein